MSYIVLLWALSNGVSTQGMILVIYWSFSFMYPLFASLKMSGLSVTYSGYWHPPTPDIIPPDNHKPKISTVCPLIPKGLTISKLQRNSMLHKQRSMELSFLKNDDERKKRSSILHSQKSCKIWSSNKKTKFHPSVSPFPSSPPDILSSIRSEFG